MSVFRALMMHKHQPLSEFIKLVPENLEFPDPESTKDLTIESNAPWTLGFKYNDETPNKG
jgi:hypothetical protein